MGTILPVRPPEDLPCPGCGHGIDRDRVRCPRCRAPIAPGDTVPKRGLAGWMWIGILLAALVLLGWVLRG